MKSIILLILILGACSAAVAAPDVPGAIGELQQAKIELEASRGVRDVLLDELNTLEASVRSDAAFKQQQADQISKLNGVIDHDKRAHVTQICWGIGAVNGLCYAGAIVCITLGLWALAIRLGIIGMLGTSLSLAMVYHSQQWAGYGFVMVVLLATCGVVYAIWHARQYKDAAKTQANILPIAAAANVVIGDTKLALKKIRDQISGPLAKKITSEVTGKPLAQITAEAAVPLANPVVPAAA